MLSRMEDVGGELNAYTTKEETALYATFLSADYARAADLLSDILFRSVFPEKELKREKEVIAEEINSYKDSPSELIFDDFDELVFDGHPIARNILGTFESVRGFGREEIFRFMENNYHTDQMVISSVGNIPLSGWSTWPAATSVKNPLKPGYTTGCSFRDTSPENGWWKRRPSKPTA